MRTIISDIQSNLEALQAALADIDRHDAENIYCQGDVVGYGPNPRECLDLVMRRCQVVFLGNHDEALYTEPVLFTPPAAQASSGGNSNSGYLPRLNASRNTRTACGMGASSFLPLP
jgi:hypothetical protein